MVTPLLVSRLQIFLSYRTVESRFAFKLKEILVRDFIGMVEVFLASDTTSIPVGSHWLGEINDGLRRSHFQIIICSKESVLCPWINYEVGAAGVREIPIIPLCHSGLTPNHLPVPLSESEGGIITEAETLQRLYARIANSLGSGIPAANFDDYAQEFLTIEGQFKKLASVGSPGVASPVGAEEVIRDPHVLCVTSQQFRELGYENQLEIVLAAFPEGMKHEFVLDSASLKSILMADKVDIIHIAAFVCPRTGDLIFTPVELPTGKSSAVDADILSADGLTALVKRARTRLVVLGGSASLVLAAQLLVVTNVIAARDIVSAKAMASWVETFYNALASEPLAAASELASEVSQAPMKLYAQQQGAPSMKVQIRALR